MSLSEVSHYLEFLLKSSWLVSRDCMWISTCSFVGLFVFFFLTKSQVSIPLELQRESHRYGVGGNTEPLLQGFKTRGQITPGDSMCFPAAPAILGLRCRMSWGEQCCCCGWDVNPTFHPCLHVTNPIRVFLYPICAFSLWFPAYKVALQWGQNSKVELCLLWHFHNAVTHTINKITHITGSLSGRCRAREMRTAVSLK